MCVLCMLFYVILMIWNIFLYLYKWWERELPVASNEIATMKIGLWQTEEALVSFDALIYIIIYYLLWNKSSLSLWFTFYRFKSPRFHIPQNFIPNNKYLCIRTRIQFLSSRTFEDKHSQVTYAQYIANEKQIIINWLLIFVPSK